MAIYKGRQVNIDGVVNTESTQVKISYAGDITNTEIVNLDKVALTTEEKEWLQKGKIDTMQEITPEAQEKLDENNRLTEEAKERNYKREIDMTPVQKIKLVNDDVDPVSSVQVIPVRPVDVKSEKVVVTKDTSKVVNGNVNVVSKN